MEFTSAIDPEGPTARRVRRYLVIVGLASFSCSNLTDFQRELYHGIAYDQLKDGSIEDYGWHHDASDRMSIETSSRYDWVHVAVCDCHLHRSNASPVAGDLHPVALVKQAEISTRHINDLCSGKAWPYRPMMHSPLLGGRNPPYDRKPADGP